MALATRKSLDFEQLTDQFARRLIYVVGNARGGSTFGNAALGIHPRLLEVRWNDKTFASFWPKRQTENADELRQILLRPPRYYDRKKAVERIGEANAQRLDDHVTALCTHHSLRGVFCLQGILFWIMCSDLQDIETLDGWCVKANTWQGVDLVKKHIPEARIVFIERDPRSTALSLAKAYARGRKDASLRDGELVQAALDWMRNATEFSIRLNRYKDSSTLVHYEDLVLQPMRTVNGFYAFLGLEPMDESDVEQALATIFYKTTSAYAETAANPTEKRVGIQTEGLNRWRGQLTAEQLDIVTALTAAGAKHYGYAIEPNGEAGGAARAIMRADQASWPKHFARYLYCRARLGLAAPHVTS